MHCHVMSTVTCGVCSVCEDRTWEPQNICTSNYDTYFSLWSQYQTSNTSESVIMIWYISLRKNDLVALFITMTSFRNIFQNSWKGLLEFKRKNPKPPSCIAQEHIREASQRRKEKAIDFQLAIWKTIQQETWEAEKE